MQLETLMRLISPVALGAVLAGCDAQLPDSGGSSAGKTSEAQSASESEAVDSGNAGEERSRADDVPNPGDVAPVTAEGREFTANDPVKGRRSRGVGGYAGAVFGARFWAEHQIIIDQIKHALQLYWAEHGNYPKSHEEFMDKIIKFNQIQLPELPPDQEYIYVSEEGQDGLHIRRKETQEIVE